LTHFTDLALMGFADAMWQTSQLCDLYS